MTHIVKFPRYNTHSMIFKEKSKLKNTKIMVMASLTERRMEAMKHAVASHGPRKVWTLNDDIFFNDGPE